MTGWCLVHKKMNTAEEEHLVAARLCDRVGERAARRGGEQALAGDARCEGARPRGLALGAARLAHPCVETIGA